MLPRHVAIVMDGNGRWAAQNKLSRIAGHRAGLTSAREITRSAVDHGIEVLSLFAFSRENWSRPDPEVKALMRLFTQSLEKEIPELHQHQVQCRFIGDRTRLSKQLQKLIAAAESLTKNNQGMVLVLAIDYGGRWDIVQSCRQLAERVLVGEITPEQIDEPCFDQTISSQGLPPPDLLIRTSGEQRLSNFYLWQLAYTELFFSDLFWPEFRASAFQQALANYATRDRRFGRSPTQLSAHND